MFEEVQLRPADRQVLAIPELCLAEPRIGLIGDNGSGKSTMLRLMTDCSCQLAGASRWRDSIRHGIAKTCRQRSDLCFRIPTTSSFSRPLARRSLSARRRAEYRPQARPTRRSAACLPGSCNDRWGRGRPNVKMTDGLAPQTRLRRVPAGVKLAGLGLLCVLLLPVGD